MNIYEEFGISQEQLIERVNSFETMEAAAAYFNISLTTVRAIKGKAYYYPSERMIRKILIIMSTRG